MRLIAPVALKDLRVELAFTVSRHLDILDPTGRGHQITAGEAVAVPFAFGAAFSPSYTNERIELLAHHVLQHDANGATGQFAQILLERLLVRQRWCGLLLR